VTTYHFTAVAFFEDFIICHHQGTNWIQRSTFLTANMWCRLLQHFLVGGGGFLCLLSSYRCDWNVNAKPMPEKMCGSISYIGPISSWSQRCQSRIFSLPNGNEISDGFCWLLIIFKTFLKCSAYDKIALLHIQMAIYKPSSFAISCKISCGVEAFVMNFTGGGLSLDTWLLLSIPFSDCLI